MAEKSAGWAHGVRIGCAVLATLIGVGVVCGGVALLAVRLMES